MFLTREGKRAETEHLRQQLSGLKDQALQITTFDQFIRNIRDHALTILKENPVALAFYKHEKKGKGSFEQLRWCDLAAIRLMDYADHAGLELEDPNRQGKKIISDPLLFLWKGIYEDLPLHPDFIEDFHQLFRQLTVREKLPLPSRKTVRTWMDRHPSGLDEEIIAQRVKNRDRILGWFIRKIEEGRISDRKYFFTTEKTFEEKLATARRWWKERVFHLRFAIRDPEVLQDILEGTLTDSTMAVLRAAREKGIPFFINPYYLSLLDLNNNGSDLAIRAYMLYSRQLVDAFGHISAWEKEDEVVPGQPNAAGWLLPPYDSIHRRYPEVAIIIPDSMGRACGGLCSVCQRMYDFQRGHLSFELETLHTARRWHEKMQELMEYFRTDKQLRDILITGGDALMGSDKSLEDILEAVYQMALQKRRDNKNRPDGKKYAGMVRVRLGTRLPAYLPQRITPKLVSLLREFRIKARRAGIRQFIIQTHFESAMEITPESRRAIALLLSSGWTVTNQLVFTAAASRRGHAAKLRKVLNDIGVLTYYTFSVKGFTENQENFATNARAVQEMTEEKRAGHISLHASHRIASFPEHAEKTQKNIEQLRKEENVPFLATDRTVMNLPGVGKSLTFRVIGLTHDGRRILEFDHDRTRFHSPIIEKMGKVRIIESKSMAAYLRQMEEMGEDIREYENVYGYSIGVTEKRQPLYDYPEETYRITKEINHLEL